jgi:AraC family transcriptional activator of pyochelin receptor
MNAIKLRVVEKEALEKVKAFLDSIPIPAPTIKTLCRSSGLNADKLKKGFKLLYGEPPYRYLLLLKMGKAKKLLVETELSINEIAWELGYEHASNFCAGFKNLVGERPREWRNSCTINET